MFEEFWILILKEKKEKCRICASNYQLPSKSILPRQKKSKKKKEKRKEKKKKKKGTALLNSRYR